MYSIQLEHLWDVWKFHLFDQEKFDKLRWNVRMVHTLSFSQIFWAGQIFFSKIMQLYTCRTQLTSPSREVYSMTYPISDPDPIWVYLPGRFYENSSWFNSISNLKSAIFAWYSFNFTPLRKRPRKLTHFFEFLRIL